MAEGIKSFFCYYGGKWRDSLKNYPSPKFPTLVEPFAGAAGYSLRYPSLKVVLCDIDPVICGVWDYLIKAKSSEILSLPDLKTGQKVGDLAIPPEAQWLVGFWLNKGSARPANVPSSWMKSEIRPKSYWGSSVRIRISSQLEFIRHWKVFNCSYENCPVSGRATWESYMVYRPSLSAQGNSL